MKLSGRLAVLLFVGLGLTAVYATDQILPATSAYQAQMRIWLAARATGLRPHGGSSRTARCT